MRNFVSVKILWIASTGLYAQDNFNGMISTYGDNQFKGYNGIIEMQHIDDDSIRKSLNGVLTIYEPQPEKFSGTENGLMDTYHLESPDTTKKPEKIIPLKNDLQPINIGVCYFDINSSKINQRSIESLKQMLSTLKSEGINKITILGYTDESGSLQFNQYLSQNRAESIKRWLILNGVNKNKIETKAMGPQKNSRNNPNIYRKAEIIITLN